MRPYSERSACTAEATGLSRPVNLSLHGFCISQPRRPNDIIAGWEASSEKRGPVYVDCLPRYMCGMFVCVGSSRSSVGDRGVLITLLAGGSCSCQFLAVDYSHGNSPHAAVCYKWCFEYGRVRSEKVYKAHCYEINERMLLNTFLMLLSV